VVESAPGFDDVADELYGLAPEQFVPARTRYEKQARRAGDRELAERIRSLGKPTVAAWLANQLVRERRAELEPLLALGADLREATRTLSGDALRQLSRRQHQLVYALVAQARELAASQGRSVTQDTDRALDATLHAALVDEQAAGELLAGRLTTALQRSGFGDIVPTAPAGPAAARKPPPAKPSPATPPADRLRQADRLRRADRDLATAEEAASRAAADLDRARAAAQAAEQEHMQASAQLERLRHELSAATAAAAAADRTRGEVATRLRRAETAVQAATRRLAEAQAKRQRLAGGD